VDLEGRNVLLISVISSGENTREQPEKTIQKFLILKCGLF
jgi:hypothetical protein